MSEKRHATLDAKSTDTYQKRKKAREDREKQKHQPQNTATNWKKSASLESLNLHDHRGLHEGKNFLIQFLIQLEYLGKEFHGSFRGS